MEGVDNRDNVVTIEEPVVSEEAKEEISLEGLSDDEIKLAEKHGLINKKEEDVDDKKEDGPEVKKDDSIVDDKDEDKRDNKEDIPLDDLDSFEKIHDLYNSKPEMFYKLPRNIKQIYHSNKWIFKKMKDEEDKRKEIGDKYDLEKINNSVARIKLDRIKNRLSNPDNLTVEELQALIDDEKKDNDEDKPLTRKDLDDIDKKKRESYEKERINEEERMRQVAHRSAMAEAYAKENIGKITDGAYKDFNEVIELAKEMAASKPRYAKQIQEIFSEEASEQEIVDVIVDIARLNPKWGKESDPVKKQDKSVEKLVKNASKQQTSAALTGGRSIREIHISEDMDPEDAARVWDKIPREIRHKILRKLS